VSDRPTPPTPVATANDDRKSAIVIAKNPRGGRFGDVPDMTPEEHKRRGDAADAPRDEAADRREAAQTPARSRAGTGAAMATPRCRASRRRSMNHSAPSRHLPKQFTDD
jgi:hypothetical protein